MIMKKITVKLIPANTSGVFHNSRQDIRQLGKVCNMLIKKVNELVDEVESLKKIQATETTKSRESDN